MEVKEKSVLPCLEMQPGQQALNQWGPGAVPGAENRSHPRTCTLGWAKPKTLPIKRLLFHTISNKNSPTAILFFFFLWERIKALPKC